MSIHAAAEVKGNPSLPQIQAQKSRSMLSTCKGIYSGNTHRFPMALVPRACTAWHSIQQLPSKPLREDSGVSKSTREGGTAASRRSVEDTRPAG